MRARVPGAMAPSARCTGGRISAVRPGSVGEEIGLEAGDLLVAIDGHEIHDLIDYRYYASEEALVVVVERDGRRHRLEVELEYGESLGLDFDEPLFDGLRQCVNRCPFCFVNQMPRGLRRSLYLRDDDYRYSFLLGNFVTLTNLTEADWRRIQEQRLSPLYVSIHATALDVRRRVLGKPDAPDIVAQLGRLGEMGIYVHGQIVIVPGMNDGPVLRGSVETLSALWPTVRTLALVPVGLTRFHRPGLRTLTSLDASRVLSYVDEIGPEIRRRLGRTWLYPSDELYLLAGRMVPEKAFYDDKAQRENGVGLVRSLMDDWQRLRGTLRPGSLRTRLTLVCGTLIAPILQGMADKLGAMAHLDIGLVPVTNRFFGATVTVSGLLTGEDVLSALTGRDLGGHICLPRAMFDADGAITLDDMTPEAIAEHLGVRVSLISTMSDVVAAVREESQARRA